MIPDSISELKSVSLLILITLRSGDYSSGTSGVVDDVGAVVGVGNGVGETVGVGEMVGVGVTSIKYAVKARSIGGMIIVY
jgi:hypothetical protein